MPIYEYRRPDGTTFEIQQSFSDDALTRDPETGVPVERVLHAPAVHFKGKGFYNTDYGKRKRRASSGGDSSESSARRTPRGELLKSTGSPRGPGRLQVHRGQGGASSKDREDGRGRQDSSRSQ